MDDYIIGIDLGTTKSGVAVFRNNKSEIIPDISGSRLIPSNVTFRDKEILIGDAAKNAMSRYENKSLYNIKRLIGKKFSNKEVEEDIKNNLFPFKIERELKNDKCIIIIERNNKKEKYYPQQISGMILRRLKKNAETYLSTNGKKITKAIITVPAYFNEEERNATNEAGKIAGFEYIKLINEPNAAALDYCITNNINNKILLIFDIGGGTFDISILKIDNHLFNVLSIIGDKHFGGVDFDNKLLNFFIDEIKNQYNVDITNNYKAKIRLKQECEKIKESLSFVNEVELQIDCLFNGNDFYYKMNRENFEYLCKDLFDKCIPLMEQALKNAKLTKNKIDNVVLVGGTSRIPKIKKIINEFFEKEKIISQKGINIDEVVTLGAALFGENIKNNNFGHYNFKNSSFVVEEEKKLINLKFININPISIGLNILNDKEENITDFMIYKGEKLPIEKKEVFVTSKNNQTKVSFDIYQGENYYSKDNIKIGGFIIENIRKAKKGEIEFNVYMKLDENGILNVEAEEIGDKKLKRKITLNNTLNLSNQEIEKFRNFNNDSINQNETFNTSYKTEDI